jgi:hypothetical protein
MAKKKHEEEAPEIKVEKVEKRPKRRERKVDEAPVVELTLEEAKKLRQEKQGQPGYRKPPPRDLHVTARQYVRLRKYKWTKVGGFLRRMKDKHGQLAKKTRPEWDVLFEAYRKRPVK